MVSQVVLSTASPTVPIGKPETLRAHPAPIDSQTTNKQPAAVGVAVSQKKRKAKEGKSCSTKWPVGAGLYRHYGVLRQPTCFCVCFAQVALRRAMWRKQRRATKLWRKQQQYQHLWCQRHGHSMQRRRQDQVAAARQPRR